MFCVSSVEHEKETKCELLAVEIAYLRSADLSSLDKMQNDEISNGT
jgi:hypothetical protein